MANQYCLSAINAAIKPDCNNMITNGVEQRGIIMNWNDIDFDTLEYSDTRPNVVTNITMKTGKKAFEVVIPTGQPWAGTGSTLQDSDVMKSVNNTVGMIILGNDPDVNGDIIDGMLNGTFVVLVENKYKNLNKTATPGDGVFQFYGLKNGLRLTTLEEDKYNTDTFGGWNVVLTESNAPTSAVFFYKDSLAATRTAFESLLGA